MGKVILGLVVLLVFVGAVAVLVVYGAARIKGDDSDGPYVGRGR